MGVFLSNEIELSLTSASFMRKYESVALSGWAGQFIQTERAWTIRFSACGMDYCIEAYRAGGAWKANTVRHWGTGFCRICGMQKNVSSYCRAFEPVAGEALKAVCMHPRVRLKAALKLKPLEV